MVLRAVDVGFVSVMIVAGGCAPRLPPPRAPVVVVVAPLPARAATALAELAPPDAPGWESREEVDVSWRGAWFPAIVLERRGGSYLVHYEGHDPAWDEIVAPHRIRERSSVAGDAPLPDDDPGDPP